MKNPSTFDRHRWTDDPAAHDWRRAVFAWLCAGLNGLAGDERIELWLQAGLPSGSPSLGPGRQTDQADESYPPAHMSLRGQWELPAAPAPGTPRSAALPAFRLALAGNRSGRWQPCTILSTSPARISSHSAGRLRRWAILVMTRHTLRRARRVIAPSQSTADDLQQWLSVPAEKLRVIPEGVDESYFATARPEVLADARRRYGLEQPFVLFVGERRPHKNLEGTLRAFEIFRRRTTRGYHLAIAGRPYPAYQQPEALAQTLGLTDWIHFIDYTPETDLPLLYQAADAAILLSHYEGFGLPVLEAMACGTPVVVSNTTSLPEVAGEAGPRVAPDEPEQAAEALLQVIPGGE